MTLWFRFTFQFTFLILYLVSLTVMEEPNLEEPKHLHYKIQSAYVNSYVAASKIGISENILQKITDTVLFVEGERREVLQEGTHKTNIGLQLKSRKNVKDKLVVFELLCFI